MATDPLLKKINKEIRRICRVFRDNIEESTKESELQEALDIAMSTIILLTEAYHGKSSELDREKSLHQATSKQAKGLFESLAASRDEIWQLNDQYKLERVKSRELQIQLDQAQENTKNE